MARYILNDEREKPTTKNTLPSKALIRIWGREGRVAGLERAWKIHTIPTYLVLCISSIWLFVSYILLQHTGDLYQKDSVPLSLVVYGFCWEGNHLLNCRSWGALERFSIFSGPPWSLLKRQQPSFKSLFRDRFSGGKDTGGRGSREYWSAWALPEVPILAPRSNPTQQPTGSRAGMPQTKQPERQEHSPTHQQTRCLKLYWAHSYLKTHPLTWPWPSEGQDPAPPTRGQAPVPATRKPAQALGTTSCTRGGHKKQEELRSCSLWKGDHKHRKLDKMRQQRNMLQAKE